jgi:hypothetical protein
VLQKGSLLWWKPRIWLTPEYLIIIELSHSVVVFMCVWACGWLLNISCIGVCSK